MIERYSRPQMAALWSEEAKYRTWLDVEIFACQAWYQLGRIPSSDIKEIEKKASFTVEEILEREKETKHDVAAFVSVVQKYIGSSGRFFHFGLTSSDVLDTAFSYRLHKSAALIEQGLQELLTLTRERALRDKNIPIMGRTHGMHAEPTSFGLKWLLWHDQIKRARIRFLQATEEISVGKLSGAVGNFGEIPPEIEEYVCKKLNLKPVTIATQVIPRDRYASYFTALGILASVVEGIAVELRHLQRTEVGEVEEGFTKGQKGSSAMPHKKNPISAENLTGLARLLRSMVIPALEDCALWHERDISHSAVERVIAPDANILSDYMIHRLHGLLKNLVLRPEKMKHNLDLLHGVSYSQRVLLALTEAGLSRDEAYEIVQENAHAALEKSCAFMTLLEADARVRKVLPAKTLPMLFDPQRSLAHIETLYKRTLE